MGRIKRKRRKKTGIFLLICLVFLIGAYIFLWSPIFKIKAVEISGNKEIKTEEIQQKIEHKNIFLYTKEEIESDLVKVFPKISDIKIKKNVFKRIIKIEITERQRVGIICKESRCFYIDAKGFIFEDAPQTSGFLILLIKDYSEKEFNLGEQILNEEIVSFIIQTKEELLNDLGIKTIDFSFYDFPYNEFKAVTSEGWYIIFNLENNLKDQLLALKAALQEKISQEERENLEYMDLRVENRIYYK